MTDEILGKYFVCLMPPKMAEIHQRIRRDLEKKFGEPIDHSGPPHVTVKYIGPVTRGDHDALLGNVMTRFALRSHRSPFHLRITGIDSFDRIEGGGTPLFLRVECPELHDFRKEMNEGWDPFSQPEKFPDFKPHMTLGYINRDLTSEEKEWLAKYEVKLTSICPTVVLTRNAYENVLVLNLSNDLTAATLEDFNKAPDAEAGEDPVIHEVAIIPLHERTDDNPAWKAIVEAALAKTRWYHIRSSDARGLHDQWTKLYGEGPNPFDPLSNVDKNTAYLAGFDEDDKLVVGGIVQGVSWDGDRGIYVHYIESKTSFAVAKLIQDWQREYDFITADLENKGLRRLAYRAGFKEYDKGVYLWHRGTPGPILMSWVGDSTLMDPSKLTALTRAQALTARWIEDSQVKSVPVHSWGWIGADGSIAYGTGDNDYHAQHAFRKVKEEYPSDFRTLPGLKYFTQARNIEEAERAINKALENDPDPFAAEDLFTDLISEASGILFGHGWIRVTHPNPGQFGFNGLSWEDASDRAKETILAYLATSTKQWNLDPESAIVWIDFSLEAQGKYTMAEFIDRFYGRKEVDEFFGIIMARSDLSPTSEDYAEFKESHGPNPGCSLGRDKDGYYVYTHRGRSPSYSSPGAIPASKVKQIERTGSAIEASTKRRFFHGTSTAFLDSIKREGLKATPPQRVWEGSLEAMDGYVYLTTSLWTATDHAMTASRKFPGEKLILVVELDRDDPRIFADEDLVPKVYGRIVEQWMHLVPRQERMELHELWELVHGHPPDPIGTNSREHAELLAKIGEGIGDRNDHSLGGLLKRFVNRDNLTIPRFAKLYFEETDSSDYPRFIKSVTERLNRDMTKYLKHIGMTRFIDPDRVVDFLMSSTIDDLDNASNESQGNRARWFVQHRDELAREWPEWFGPEAGMLSGEMPTVAVRDDVKPDEYWVIRGSLRDVKRYDDLENRGERVAGVLTASTKWDDGILLHGTDKKFDRFKAGAYWRGHSEEGHGLIYFSDPNRRPGRKTQAEHIAEARGWLAVVRFDEARSKPFQPTIDDQAADIVREAAKHEWVQASNERLRQALGNHIPYEWAFIIAKLAIPKGYNTFKFWEPSVHEYSIAISDPDLVEIVEWQPRGRNAIMIGKMVTEEVEFWKAIQERIAAKRGES